MPSRSTRDISGILLLDKALGVSSNAALQQVRALYGAAKAGHAGSLDPLASGLLPVCFGQATKVCGRLLQSGKMYRVLVQLGASTPSGDCETQIDERAPIPPLTAAGVDAVLATFIGEQQQVPPMHSALKFEGKRLYELARRGESVERAARSIVIHRLQRVGFEADCLEFDVECSKGTYIRTLAADIARRLGTIGHLKALRRVSIEPFGGLPMYTFQELASRTVAERDALLLAPDSAFPDVPEVRLDAAATRNLLLGRTVSPVAAAEPRQLRAYDGDGRFLGMVQGLEDGQIQPVRLFVRVEATEVSPGSPRNRFTD